MKLQPEDSIVLKLLLRAPNHTRRVYDIHAEFLLSPGQLARSIQKLLDETLIVHEHGTVKLTDSAVEWLIKNRSIFYKVNKTWKDIPNNFRGPKLGAEEIYLPENINNFNFKNERGRYDISNEV